jgi:NAD(P)-dependent dehydrogenase (short-subunit alcohol dehydrogenase family)
MTGTRRWKKKLLAGKRVIVTGCASGIGRESARLARRLGAYVIGIDRAMTHAHVDELYRADLAERHSVKALLAALPDGVDGLANCAGVPPEAPPEEALAVNFVALRQLTVGLVPKLADGASIVNLAFLADSDWNASLPVLRESFDLDFDGVADFVRRHALGHGDGRAYRLSKAAVSAWTLHQQQAWRTRGIRMNCVSPGRLARHDRPAGTGATADELPAAQPPRDAQRAGTPADIAPLVAFLLADVSGWIRGADIPVDGGQAAVHRGERYGL